MPDYPLYPYSPTIDAHVDGGIVDDIAEEARQAFFAVVVERWNDYYPGSTTYGDESPGEMIDRDRIARTWVESFAWNNSAVQGYMNEDCILRDMEAVNPGGLFTEGYWPEGLRGVDVHAVDPDQHGMPSLVDIRGTRSAIVDFVLVHWEGTDDLEDQHLNRITSVQS